MPITDGYAVLAHIREDLKISKLETILLTNSAPAIDDLKNREHKADLYLAKPFNPRELLSLK